MASTNELVSESVADLTKTENEKTFKTMTMNERFQYMKDLITVEPLVACYLIPSVLCLPALLNLEIEKSCKASSGYNDSMCEAIVSGDNGNYTTETFIIQDHITNMHTWNQPIQSFLPLILILFLGSYSDRHKLRKPFLIMPLVGELFSVIGCMLSAIYMHGISLEMYGAAQTIVPSFFGSSSMIIVMVFAYIADVSTIEMRTLRIGMLQVFLNFCSPIVQLVSAPLFIAIGYVGTFSIAGVIYIIGILYGLFILKEPRQPVVTEKKTNLLSDLFNPKHIVDTFSLLVKKNPENKRTYVIILMVIMFLTVGIGTGEGSVFFLYTQIVYGWSVVELTYFMLFNTLIHLKGTLIAIPLFTKVFKLSDYSIINLSLLDKVLSNIILAFASTTTVLYIGTYLSLINGVSMIGIRSLATKVVSENDLGKAQTLFGVCEAIGGSLAVPIYSQSYSYMKKTFPGGFFLFGVFIFSLCILLIFWMYMNERKKNKVEADEKSSKGIQMEEAQTTHI